MLTKPTFSEEAALVGRWKKVILDAIQEEGLIVKYLTNEMTVRRVPGFGNL